MAGIFAQQCQVMFVSPTLRGNYSPLLIASNLEEGGASLQSRAFLCSHIRDFQQRNNSMTILYHIIDVRDEPTNKKLCIVCIV